NELRQKRFPNSLREQASNLAGSRRLGPHPFSHRLGGPIRRDLILAVVTNRALEHFGQCEHGETSLHVPRHFQHREIESHVAPLVPQYLTAKLARENRCKKQYFLYLIVKCEYTVCDVLRIESALSNGLSAGIAQSSRSTAGAFGRPSLTRAEARSA